MMIGYTILRDGVVVRTGACHKEDLEHQAGIGETVEEGIREFEQGVDVPHWRQKRKSAYPQRGEFEDAFYHYLNGDESKMQEWKAKCEAVKSSIPKED